MPINQAGGVLLDKNSSTVKGGTKIVPAELGGAELCTTKLFKVRVKLAEFS